MGTRNEINLPKRSLGSNDDDEAARVAQNKRINKRKQCLCTCVSPFVLSLQNNIVKYLNYEVCGECKDTMVNFPL